MDEERLAIKWVNLMNAMDRADSKMAMLIVKAIEAEDWCEVGRLVGELK